MIIKCNFQFQNKHIIINCQVWNTILKISSLPTKFLTNKLQKKFFQKSILDAESKRQLTYTCKRHKYKKA